MTRLRVLDLFSGIGGFSLGLERSGGFETVAFCEIDPFCRRVLANHWPKVPCYDDVRVLTAARLAADGIAVDVICGGFPCQDLSLAGNRAGLEGARSGLWGEYRRVIGEVLPRFVIVENVPGLLSLGMGTVLGDLSALGFDAVWDCVPASAVGAAHQRDRVWLIAYASDIRRDPRRPEQPLQRLRASSEASVADSDKPVASQERQQRGRQLVRPGGDPKAHSRGRSSSHWLSEPDVGRVAHGVPARVDRLRSLGNAVVPQITEMIGRAIMCSTDDNPPPEMTNGH
jgi:DNA (cytosine-5)-methyltransferase 1